MSKRHSWEKNPAKIQKIAFWEMSKRHFWKKNPDLKSGLDSPKFVFFFWKSDQNNWNVAKWIIFPEMTLPDIPKRICFLLFDSYYMTHITVLLGWIPRNFKIFIFKPKLSFLKEIHKNDN